MPHFDSMIQQKILLKRKLLQNQAVVNLLCNVGNNVAEFEDFKTGSKSPAEPLIKPTFMSLVHKQMTKTLSRCVVVWSIPTRM